MRGESFGTRAPPTSPVSPRSPVRVYTRVMLIVMRPSSRDSAAILLGPLLRRTSTYLRVHVDHRARSAPEIHRPEDLAHATGAHGRRQQVAAPPCTRSRAGVGYEHSRSPEGLRWSSTSAGISRDASTSL